MMRIGIGGIGVLGGFGCGLSALAAALDKGKVMPESREIITAGGKIQVPALCADTSALADYVSPKALRRNDHYTRMALLASFLALEDAGISVESGLDRLGIIVATGLGSTCNTLDFEDIMSGKNTVCSPTRFSNSVHNAAAAHISIFLRSQGPNLSVNQFDISVPSAFMTACHWLREERTDTVLIGGLDEFSKVMAYYRFNRGKSGQQADSPLPVGEGAAFFLLTSVPEKIRYGFVTDAFAGNPGPEKMKIPEDALLITDREDYEADASGFEKLFLPKAAPLISCSHLYGSLPVGMGFDIAIAGILMQRRIRIFPTDCILRPGREISQNAPVCCLKKNDSGESGFVLLSPAEIIRNRSRDR